MAPSLDYAWALRGSLRKGAVPKELIFFLREDSPFARRLKNRYARKEAENRIERPVVRGAAAGKKEDKISVPFLCKARSGRVLKKPISKATCEMSGDPHCLLKPLLV